MTDDFLHLYSAKFCFQEFGFLAGNSFLKTTAIHFNLHIYIGNGYS